MSHYSKQCPYCGRTIEEGHGLPLRELGDPKRTCRFCGNTYIDRHILDWNSATPFRKFLFCLDNGRFLICLILYTIVSTRVGSNVNWKDWQVYLACLPVFLVAFALCILYVKLKVKILYPSLSKDFIQCDECKEYSLSTIIKYYHLKDGRTLCERCAEGIDEDEIDFIEDNIGVKEK